MTVIGDYTFLEAGTFDNPATFQDDKLYRTQYKFMLIDPPAAIPVWGFFFKRQFVSGDTFKLGVETNFTLADFTINNQNIIIWKPSDYVLGIGSPTYFYTQLSNPDNGPYDFPYNYALNDISSPPTYLGGRRIEFVVNESGWWVWGFYYVSPV